MWAVRFYSRIMPRFAPPGTITFWPGAARHAGWVLLLATLVTARAQTSQVISLNGTWDFAFAADAPAADRLARFYEDSFQGGGFQPVPVPSNWSLLGFEEPIYARPRQAGEGFYLRRFEAPENLSGKRVLLHFGGVWASAEVWLNSAPLGRHDSGLTGFAYDVSGILKPGAENRLAVRAGRGGSSRCARSAFQRSGGGTAPEHVSQAVSGRRRREESPMG